MSMKPCEEKKKKTWLQKKRHFKRQIIDLLLFVSDGFVCFEALRETLWVMGGQDWIGIPGSFFFILCPSLQNSEAYQVKALSKQLQKIVHIEKTCFLGNKADRVSEWGKQEEVIWTKKSQCSLVYTWSWAEIALTAWVWETPWVELRNSVWYW